MDSREGLLTEMLHRFSELPAETVQAHVNLYPRNRDALISELTRVLSLSRASPGYTDSIEGGEMLYSNFEASMGVEGSELGSLPLPEPPPSLVITPPTSPEKTVDKFTNTTSHAGSGNNGDTLSYVPALSIARGASGIINDLGYEEFLLQNQRQRLKALEEAYKRNETCLANLRREVLAKERFLFEETLITNFDNNVNNNNVNITIDTLLELTQANRQLSVQNHCLITEVDLQTDGCAPLGDVTRHAFYDQIYPGPRDPLVEIDSRTPSRNPTVSNTIVNPPSAGNGTMNGDEEDDDVNDADRWVCQACTLKNHPEIIFCEACFSPKPVAQPATSCSSKIGGGNNQQKPDSASPSRSTDDVNSSVPTVNNTMNVTGSNHSNNSNSKYARIVKEASSSSDSSLSLSDSSSSSGVHDVNVQVQVTGIEDRTATRSPICLRIRQRTPKDSITFRFYKNINRGSSNEVSPRAVYPVPCLIQNEPLKIPPLLPLYRHACRPHVLSVTFDMAKTNGKNNMSIYGLYDINNYKNISMK